MLSQKRSKITRIPSRCSRCTTISFAAIRRCGSRLRWPRASLPGFGRLVIVWTYEKFGKKFNGKTDMPIMRDMDRMSRMLSAPPGRAGIPVFIGIVFLGLCWFVATWIAPNYAAGIIGILVSSAACFVMLVAMPRAAQLSLFGAAVGVTADGAYATFTDQTPITIASGLVRLADSLGKAVGLIATDAGTGQLTIIPIGIWSFILCTIAIMGESFLIKHDA